MTLKVTLDHQFYFRNGFWRSKLYGKVVLHYFLGILVQKLHFLCFRYANYMLISYYANKKSSPRLPLWQPSLIFFNIPIESGTIIKPCTLKHFQVTYMLHKAGYWTNIVFFTNMITATYRDGSAALFHQYKRLWNVRYTRPNQMTDIVSIISVGAQYVCYIPDSKVHGANMGPMLSPWTLLSGIPWDRNCVFKKIISSIIKSCFGCYEDIYYIRSPVYTLSLFSTCTTEYHGRTPKQMVQMLCFNCERKWLWIEFRMFLHSCNRCEFV